ncbi:hypothetical protein [Halocola ammonii]
MNRISLIVAILSFFSVSKSWGQQLDWPYSRTTEELQTFDSHDAIQPYVQHSYKPVESQHYNTRLENGKNSKLRPLAYLSGGYQIDPEQRIPAINLAGVEYYNQFNPQWSVRASYIAGFALFPNYFENYAESRNIFPGIGPNRSKSEMTFGNQFMGSVKYSPTEHFSFELGNGKNFWGSGHRSLILSDLTSPYPYFKINTRVWKLQLTNLYSRLQNFTEDKLLGDTRAKYTASHALSFQATPKLNFTLFESVVWQATDSMSTRNFEFNYINPVIFYRPVEYYQGSADNVLLGLGFEWQAIQTVSLYGQLVVDEFLLREVMDRNGWWGNKFAGQLGVFLTPSNPNGYSFRSEVNVARPFTYTHGSPIQSYTHLGQSLAHPLGTNFFEWINILEYESSDWHFEEQFNWAIFGRDVDGQNFGGDIFRSYTNPAMQYGNEIGQGQLNEVLLNKLTIERKVGNSKARVFLSHMWRVQVTDDLRDVNHFALIGVKINVTPPISDF